MSGPEAREFPEFSYQESREREFLQKAFGLVQVNPQKERGLPRFAYISEFDGWAVETESFLNRWLEFSPVKLLHERFQLGLNRSFPLPNNHTRFEHSAEVALRSVLVLTRLAHESRGEFLALSQDYSLNLNPDLSGEQRENEQVLKTIKLGAIYAANHDIATPAGGDTVKYIFGLDDDRDLPQVLKWNFEEFSRLCWEDGFNPKEVIKLFTRLAKRKEKGILGQLIHRSGGKDRGFDLDSICYTLMDAQVCLGLSWDPPGRGLTESSVVAVREVIEPRIKKGELPPEFLSVFLGHYAVGKQLAEAAVFLENQQKEINRRAEDWVEGQGEEFRNLYRHALPYPFISLPSFRPQRPPLLLGLGDFSLLTSIALKDGQIVFTDPSKLDNLSLLHDFLSEYVYLSPSSLGPEVGLAVAVQSEKTAPPLEKEKHFLLTVGDHELLEALKENFPNQAYWFSDLAALGWEGGNLHRGTKTTWSIHFNEWFVPRDFAEWEGYSTALFLIRDLPTRLKTPVLVRDRGGKERVKNYEQVFPQRKQLIERKSKLSSHLDHIFPRWARPNSWIWQDEYERPSRHILERQPYW